MRPQRIRMALALGVLAALPFYLRAHQAAPRPASRPFDAAQSRPEPAEGRGGITKGGDDRTGGYDVVERWWKAAPNHDNQWTWGQVSGLAVDNPNRILVVTRGDWPVGRPGSQQIRRTNFVVVADQNGSIVETWRQWDSIMSLRSRRHLDSGGRIGLGPVRETEPASQVQPGRRAPVPLGHVRNDGGQLAGRPGASAPPRQRSERQYLHRQLRRWMGEQIRLEAGSRSQQADRQTVAADEVSA